MPRPLSKRHPLSRVMEIAGLQQKDIAEITGRTPSQVKDSLRGKGTKFTSAELQEIAAKTGAPLAYLHGKSGTDAPTFPSGQPYTKETFQAARKLCVEPAISTEVAASLKEELLASIGGKNSGALLSTPIHKLPPKYRHILPALHRSAQSHRIRGYAAEIAEKVQRLVLAVADLDRGSIIIQELDRFIDGLIDSEQINIEDAGIQNQKSGHRRWQGLDTPALIRHCESKQMTFRLEGKRVFISMGNFCPSEELWAELNVRLGEIRNHLKSLTSSKRTIATNSIQ